MSRLSVFATAAVLWGLVASLHNRRGRSRFFEIRAAVH